MWQEGVFAGVTAVFDKALGSEELAPLREALLAGGGREAAAAFLGSGATHVVSQIIPLSPHAL